MPSADFASTGGEPFAEPAARPPKIVLVLGGARSGKSEIAERLVGRRGDRVTYLATAEIGDADFARRVERHRLRRPHEWATVETGAALPAALLAAQGTVLVDSLGTWLAAFPDFEVDAAALCEALKSRSGDSVVVSEEVGLGVHPETEVGRRFRDALGALNQAVAQASDQAFLVVAGRLLALGDA